MQYGFYGERNVMDGAALPNKSTNMRGKLIILVSLSSKVTSSGAEISTVHALGMYFGTYLELFISIVTTLTWGVCGLVSHIE